MGRKNFGFTLMELLIVIATVGILGAMAIFAAKTQIAKGRDARRKSDLAKIQKALEDYMNDTGCYPSLSEITEGDGKICNKNFSPYLTPLPCDPINNTYFNYFYSTSAIQSCKSWYKIYARLEYTKDPIIEKAGCINGCGPSKNYNYWVSSPNMQIVEQTDEEFWWPPIGGVTPSPTLTFTPTPSPTVSPTSTPTSTLSPTATPTPLPSVSPSPTPTSSPTSPPSTRRYGCFGGVCISLPEDLYCEPSYDNETCNNECGSPENECQ